MFNDFDLIDEMLDNFMGLGNGMVAASNKAGAANGKKLSYPITSFPPTRVTQDKKDGSLHFKFLLAGYKKEDINLSFEKDKLTVSAKAKHEDVRDNFVVIADGIKTPEFSYSYIVPEKVFDKKKISAKMEDGVLRVYIPMKEKKDIDTAKINISIN